MISQEELRKIANSKKEREGKEFAKTKIQELAKKMKERAELGFYELREDYHSELDQNSWLSEPHLYNPVIKELQEYRYTTSHSDDLRDGTYLIIKW